MYKLGVENQITEKGRLSVKATEKKLSEFACFGWLLAILGFSLSNIYITQPYASMFTGSPSLCHMLFLERHQSLNLGLPQTSVSFILFNYICEYCLQVKLHSEVPGRQEFGEIFFHELQFVYSCHFH